MALTEFQFVTERALISMLGRRSRRLLDRVVDGEGEEYIVAKLSGTPLEVYIYDDEAQIQGPGVDERFERQDFRDAEALRRAFLCRVLALVENE